MHLRIPRLNIKNLIESNPLKSRILGDMPNLPPNIMPTKIRRLIISRKFLTDIRIPPLKIKKLLESNLLTSRILVRICMYECMCICVYTYIYIYIYVYTYMALLSVLLVFVLLLLGSCYHYTRTEIGHTRAGHGQRRGG